MNTFPFQYLSMTLLSCEGFPYAVVISGVISNDVESMTLRHSVNIWTKIPNVSELPLRPICQNL